MVHPSVIAMFGTYRTRWSEGHSQEKTDICVNANEPPSTPPKSRNGNKRKQNPIISVLQKRPQKLPTDVSAGLCRSNLDNHISILKKANMKASNKIALYIT